LKQQGPWCPPLVDYLEHQQAGYDALIFFTYLYAPTVLGVRVAPARSVLVPTAHDEPAIQLDIYRELFSLPAAIAYNTEPERRFVAGRFPARPAIEETIGCGVDLPQHHAYPRLPDAAPETAAPVGDEPQDEHEAAPPRRRSHLTERGAVFRRRHRLHGPFVLYGGRIEKGKGCEELIEYFSTYVGGGGDARLVLMGVKLMPLPEDPFINFAGLLSDRERLQALEAATVVSVPSPYESLSLLALEAFAVGTPILANARSEVLVDHCLRSNAGLFYADRDEFVECLSLLVADERLRAALGQHGRDYVRRHYRWDVIVNSYERLIGRLRAR
jgi:glycosyltransferase involved in cell wall biosynthesis